MDVARFFRLQNLKATPSLNELGRRALCLSPTNCAASGESVSNRRNAGCSVAFIFTLRRVFGRIQKEGSSSFCGDVRRGKAPSKVRRMRWKTATIREVVTLRKHLIRRASRATVRGVHWTPVQGAPSRGRQDICLFLRCACGKFEKFIFFPHIVV